MKRTLICDLANLLTEILQMATMRYGQYIVGYETF